MATTNKITSKPHKQNLSIQISLNGLSFCILDIEKQAIVYLKTVNTNKPENPYKILDLLKETFETEKPLQADFNDIQVIHENELAAVVPDPLFSEDHLADYLKFNAKILRSDFISFDTIANAQCKNVYVPYVNINNYIFEHFGAFSYKHFSTILIEQVLQQTQSKGSTCLYVHVAKNHFEIVAIKAGSLELYNSFEYRTKEDFIYYLLFTAEQLQLTPDSLDLYFLGAITETDPLYQITHKYVRNVHFGQRKDYYKLAIPTENKHQNFTLISSF
ncbi:DUF3822 family protein [Bizionia sediminis]|uniref:DUF3822 family protein n=1 Tax=Bizionia sediminis TaxID=1737064 RepID=A0ABW5KRR2_9FLAO